MTTQSTDTVSVPLAAGHWALDPLHSAVGFTIRHLGISKVRGRFEKFTADLTVGETLDTTSVTATIEVASINTGNNDRDAHVLASDLLDVAKRPTLTYRSTAIVPDGEDWKLEGELTIGEVTRPITLALEFGGVEDFGGTGRHAGFEATGEIRRRDYGLDFAPGLLGEVVKISLDLQFIEPS
ncbi:YceI family protein [Actinomadura hibisca]|uniref:YceI family protein n=1 Tax=Actinomadura hibisca TaxID=68565 RepID=UPI00082EF81B|nr:YceI family protein [Actinomadura hibisca]